MGNEDEFMMSSSQLYSRVEMYSEHEEMLDVSRIHCSKDFGFEVRVLFIIASKVLYHAMPGIFVNRFSFVDNVAW